MKSVDFKQLARESTVGSFAPTKWWFWRALLVSCIIVCFLGHWMEIGYCTVMDLAFNIVEDDYAAVVDPIYVPYRIYGYGALAMTFLLEPLKDRFLRRRKTVRGAFLEMFAVAVFLSMALELGFGLAINQPDATGHYPYWDNSQLPLNVLGQAWLVNDFFIGLAAMFYLWVVFPVVTGAFSRMPRRLANIVFAVIVVAFAAVMAISAPYL